VSPFALPSFELRVRCALPSLLRFPMTKALGILARRAMCGSSRIAREASATILYSPSTGLHVLQKRPACDRPLSSSQVTLIYHKKLDDDWRAAAEKLRTALSEAPSCSEAAVTLIGRSHKQARGPRNTMPSQSCDLND